MRQCVLVALLAVTALGLACDESKGAPRSADEQAGGDDGARTEQVYAGVAKTHGAVELEGGVRLTSDGSQVTWIEFDIALAAGTEPMYVTGPAGHIEMAYIDAATAVDGLTYFARESTGDGDGLLEPGEAATIRIDLADACPECAIGPDHIFTLELKPPNGSYLVLQRTTPSALAPSFELD